MNKYVIYILFFITQSVLAYATPPIKSYTFKFYRAHSNQKVTLFLNRIPRSGGEPVILAHPLALNNLAVQKMGEKLWELGFDVWLPNTRGHGIGEKRSMIEPYHHGDYSVDFVIAEDWPHVLHALYEETGKKISIMGYSMGGMTWYQTLNGVYSTPEGLFQNEVVAKERAKMVKNLVLLATPPDLDQVSQSVAHSVLFMSPLVHNFSFFFPLTTYSAEEDDDTQVSYTEIFRRKMVSFFSPFLYAILPSGLILKKNLSEAELEQQELIIKHTSALHTDCISDFFRWLRAPYCSRDGNVSYVGNKKVFVPTLFIFPSEDSLIPVNYGIQEAQKIAPQSNVSILIAKGFGHLDIGLTKGLDLIVPSISSFFKHSFVVNPHTEALYAPTQSSQSSQQ